MRDGFQIWPHVWQRQYASSAPGDLLVVATLSERQNGHLGGFAGIDGITLVMVMRLPSATSMSAWPQFAAQRIRELSQCQRTRIASASAAA